MKAPTLMFVLALVLLAFIMLALPEPLIASAQTQPQATVINTVGEAQADGLALSILFTVFDANGYPIPKDDIRISQEGQVQLLTSSSVPARATIEEATTPLKIALVLDASGSMAPYIAQVKAAAIKFIDDAPANAEFAVFRFADDFVTLQDFTKRDKSELLKNAITNMSPARSGTGDTCVYKAAFEAVNVLNAAAAQNPEERRSIVLFTDGKDREAGGQQCGEIQEGNVVSQATLSGRIPIQIHTIGLCKDAGCSNVDRGNLKKLSDATFAFTASGVVNDLDDVFSTIMDGLTSQWIAKAKVLAVKGPNRANLSFSATIKDSDKPFNLTTDEFNSEQDYTAPPATVKLSRTFDPDKNVYNLTLLVTNPESISDISVDAWDVDGGTIVSTEPTMQVIRPEMGLTQKTDGFKAGAEYCSRVRAKGKNGLAIKNDKGEEILDQNCGIYQPKVEEVPTIQLAVREYDQANNVYTLTLHVTNPQAIGWITVEAFDEATASSIDSSRTILNVIKPEIVTTQKTDGFKVGAKYCTRISAANNSGVPITNNDGTEILAQDCGVYEPGQIVFGIKSVDVNWDNKTLEIQLKDISNPANKGLIYEGHINDGSRLVSNINRSILLGDVIQVPLPSEDLEKVEQGGGKLEYTLYLTLQAEGTALNSTVEYPFKPTVQDFWTTLGKTLGNPAILGSILIIALIVCAVVVLLLFRTKNQPLAPPPVQNPPTQIFASPRGRMADGAKPGMAAPRREMDNNLTLMDPGADAPVSPPLVQVRIRVLRTPDASQIRESVVSHFPCVIGRGLSSAFPITGDASLGRAHAEISLQDGRLIITDLKSVNGTYVGAKKLDVGGAAELGLNNRIRLGRNTELDIETLGGSVLTQFSSGAGWVK